jgi:hypothetical protein
MLPLSPEPMRSSTGNSIESVEQPWILSQRSYDQMRCNLRTDQSVDETSCSFQYVVTISPHFSHKGALGI